METKKSSEKKEVITLNAKLEELAYQIAYPGASGSDIADHLKELLSAYQAAYPNAEVVFE
jgi:hypothetical protein